MRDLQAAKLAALETKANTGKPLTDEEEEEREKELAPPPPPPPPPPPQEIAVAKQAGNQPAASDLASALASAAAAHREALHLLELAANDAPLRNGVAASSAATSWRDTAAALRRQLQSAGVLPTMPGWDDGDSAATAERVALTQAAHAALEREVALRADVEAARAETSALRAQLSAAREREAVAADRLEERATRLTVSQEAARSARESERRAIDALEKAKREHTEALARMAAPPAPPPPPPAAPPPLAYPPPPPAPQEDILRAIGTTVSEGGDSRVLALEGALAQARVTQQRLLRSLHAPAAPAADTGLATLLGRIEALEASMAHRPASAAPVPRPPMPPRPASAAPVPRRPMPPEPAQSLAAFSGPSREMELNGGASTTTMLYREREQAFRAASPSPLPSPSPRDDSSLALPALAGTAHSPSPRQQWPSPPPPRRGTAPGPNSMDEAHLREARIRYFKERVEMQNRLRAAQETEGWN